MIKVTKTMTTETAHRLMDYVGKCSGIHGHSYLWEVTARREDDAVGSNGIAIDFADLKAAMRSCIYDRFDHALVLSKEDPLVEAEVMKWDSNGDKQKIFSFYDNPTAECFAVWAAIELQKFCDATGEGKVMYGSPAHIIITRVRVWETANSNAEWNRSS